MTVCLFAMSPLAPVSNSTDRLLLLNQLVTARRNQHTGRKKSAFKTMTLFFCCFLFVQGIARGNVLSAFSAQAISHSRRERLQTTAWRSAQIGTSLPMSFCSGSRRREGFSEGPPLRHARCARAELQPCGELCLCIHSAGCHGDAAHFRPGSLLRMGSAKWKTLK